ncbi:hypothetical protein [Minwuia thermotolerans]|uniref:Acyl-CoA transferase n=1 Tax=Minwuia thermotolerans TaxID=2056226 RepID=A0A2M9G2L3_9PROT|nr:hypothetical protein [Minwuia thermotolerans]PJK29953.1 hypothetical protein CVT23_09300 [Minwuia thermotolerans]
MPEPDPSPRETALTALAAAVAAALPEADVRRNEPGRQRIPAGGLVSVNDGDPGNPEVSLSPPRYWFRHRAEIVVVVEGYAAAARATATDRAVSKITAALEADPTLSGAVEYAEAGAPKSEDLADEEGGTPLRGVSLPVVLDYQSSSAAG